MVAKTDREGPAKGLLSSEERLLEHNDHELKAAQLMGSKLCRILRTLACVTD